LVIHLRRLLIRTGAIGDFIVSLPAMESLRADYTEVWCAWQNAPLAGFADSAQSIVASGLDGLGLLPSEHVLDRLRGFDSVISWYGSGRPEFRELIRELGLPFSFLPALPVLTNPAGHAVEFYNRQARELGAVRPSRLPRIECPPVERTFAVIHPFASSVAKRAPMTEFERIAGKLSEHVPVHWLCGPEEELAGAVRIDDLFELACWLRGARIYVGNDSGISHLAAAVETPVVAFFRTTDPRVWSPRGVSVHVVKEP
jgi:lipopolysaccharide heptosyltransferase III